jgi:hypothetical protein
MQEGSDDDEEEDSVLIVDYNNVLKSNRMTESHKGVRKKSKLEGQYQLNN